jgi:hypothetical protein
MFLRKSFGLLAALLPLACAGSLSPVPQPPPIVVAPGPSATVASAPADQAAACAVLRQRHVQTLRELPPLHESCSVPYFSAETPFTCHANAAGAWALVASKRTVAQLPRAECPLGDLPVLELDLVYRSTQGQEVIGPQLDHFMDGWGGTSVSLPLAFDYDGDGVLEAVVGEEHDGEGWDETVLSIHALLAGTIVPYAPAKPWKLRAVHDDDGDGRPDLYFDALRSSTSNVGIVDTVATFSGLAHSLPDGTFSMSGAAVTEFHRRLCPQANGRLVFFENGARDDALTGQNIVCARARGVPVAELQSELDSACSAWSEDLKISDPQHRSPSEPCPSWWLKWLREAVDHGVR